MRLLSTINFAFLVAGTVGTISAFILPADGDLSTPIASFTGLPCNGPQCNRVIDINYFPKTFAQDLGTRETSLAIRDSSLTIRDTSLGLRDPFPNFAASTTTTTITTPVVTVTMSCWGSSFTPIDGTTYHCSTTIPPSTVVPNINSISNGMTILSDGTPAATITSPDHPFTVMPPPIITSARSFVTISNASTTIVTHASNLTWSTTNINSSAFGNITASSSYVPAVTLTNLFTVDPPSETSAITSGTSTYSTMAPSAPSTNTAQSSRRKLKHGHNKLGTVLVLGLTVNVVLAAIL